MQTHSKPSLCQYTMGGGTGLWMASGRALRTHLLTYWEKGTGDTKTACLCIPHECILNSCCVATHHNHHPYSVLLQKLLAFRCHSIGLAYFGLFWPGPKILLSPFGPNWARIFFKKNIFFSTKECFGLSDGLGASRTQNWSLKPPTGPHFGLFRAPGAITRLKINEIRKKKWHSSD